MTKEKVTKLSSKHEKHMLFGIWLSEKMPSSVPGRDLLTLLKMDDTANDQTLFYDEFDKDMPRLQLQLRTKMALKKSIQKAKQVARNKEIKKQNRLAKKNLDVSTERIQEDKPKSLSVPENKSDNTRVPWHQYEVEEDGEEWVEWPREYEGGGRVEGEGEVEVEVDCDFMCDVEGMGGGEVEGEVDCEVECQVEGEVEVEVEVEGEVEGEGEGEDEGEGEGEDEGEDEDEGEGDVEDKKRKREEEDYIISKALDEMQ